MIDMQEMLRRQSPWDSEFGYRSSASDVLRGTDMSGKTALVTGGYSGLGLETVRALVAAGAEVIVPARRPDRAEETIGELAGVRIVAMDLSDLDSVDVLTADLRSQGQRLDLVMNIAGVMATPEQRTAQGHEWQFGTNHLGHAALVLGVAELLAEESRVIAYSSSAHYRSPVLFDDINFEHTPYDPWVSYGQSKTANALFAVGLDERMAERRVHAFSVHPGGIMTDLQRHMPREELLARQWIDEAGEPNPLFKTPEQGASTGLWAATAAGLRDRGGIYAEDCAVKGIVPPEHSDMTTGGVKEWAIDPEAANRLWELTVATIGRDLHG